MAGASLLVWQEGQEALRGAPPPGSEGTRAPSSPGARSAFEGGRSAAVEEVGMQPSDGASHLSWSASMTLPLKMPLEAKNTSLE